MRSIRVLFAVATIIIPALATAAPVVSEAEACAVLSKAVSEHIQLRNDPNDYYCDDFLNVSHHYYVFAFRGPLNPGGSNLIGWHAVRRSDGAAFEWDISENTPRCALKARKGAHEKSCATQQDW
jgi:hypothetical protein